MNQNEFLQYVGKKIKEIRTARGLSVHILADKIGISPRAIEDIEEGLIASSLADLYDIASVLEVHPKDLFN